MANRKLAKVPKRIASGQRGLVSVDALEGLCVRRALIMELGPGGVGKDLVRAGPASLLC